MIVSLRQFILALLILTFFGCRENSVIKNVNSEPIQIVVQPFDDLDKSIADFVFKKIKTVYPKVILNEKIPLPRQAFYEPRNRFKADSILSYFKKFATRNRVIMGLTSKDISTKKDKVEDFGIMGLGNCPGNACVASLFRLDKENMNEQFFKIAIHEIGHTQGLPHCNEKFCFMRDAEGKNPTNEEKEFCSKCKLHLKSKGFQL